VTLVQSKAYPPNYEEICAAFDIKGRPGIVFTWGGTLFNPSGVDIPPDLWAHEAVHETQQYRPSIVGPAEWWRRYIAESEFRLDQELEAYRAQYRFAQESYGRDQRRRLLKHVSQALAGPMYGHLMSASEAKRAITSP